MHADPICNHSRWDQEYGFLLAYIPDFFGDLRKDQRKELASYLLPVKEFESRFGHVTSEDGKEFSQYERLTCVLTHKVGCQCSANVHSGAV